MVQMKIPWWIFWLQIFNLWYIGTFHTFAAEASLWYQSQNRVPFIYDRIYLVNYKTFDTVILSWMLSPWRWINAFKLHGLMWQIIADCSWRSVFIAYNVMTVKSPLNFVWIYDSYCYRRALETVLFGSLNFPFNA